VTGKPAQTATAADRAGEASLLPGALLAGAGTFIAIAALGGLAALSAQPFVPGSFGASCVLLFGFPAGPFSQPRNLAGGHLRTTTVGLVFLTLFGPGWLAMAGAAAVAVAVALMILTRTVHPPAGSNPVIIFVGHAGWSFLLMPTAVGAGTLLAIAWVFWRAKKPGTWPVRWW
jgi:CBS-domain-containing membrane protein